MNNSSSKLSDLKKQYEAALVNEAHSQWTIESASLMTRIFGREELLHEENMRQQYAEQARRTALQIHALDPQNGMWVTTDIERDVKTYMEQRKADHNK
jgi:hypothetical protein